MAARPQIWSVGDMEEMYEIFDLVKVQLKYQIEIHRILSPGNVKWLSVAFRGILAFQVFPLY